MNLIWEPFHNVINFKVLLVFPNSGLVFILRWQNSNGDRDLGSVVGIYHCWMDGGSSLERRAFLTAQIDDFSTPAVAHDAERLEARIFALDSFQNLRNAPKCLWRCGWALEEGTQFLALFGCVRRVPGDVGWVTLEEVWHENLVRFLMITRRQNIGTLNSLREVAEDVINNEDAMFGIR